MQWRVIYDAKLHAFFINPASIWANNYFHQSNFHFGKELFLSIQLPFTQTHKRNDKYTKILGRKHQGLNTLKCAFTQKIILINPASILTKNCFHQSNFHLGKQLFLSIQLPFTQPHSLQEIINRVYMYTLKYSDRIMN